MTGHLVDDHAPRWNVEHRGIVADAEPHPVVWLGRRLEEAFDELEFVRHLEEISELRPRRPD